MRQLHRGSSVLLTVLIAVVVSLAVTYLVPRGNDSAVQQSQKESVYDRVIRTGTIRCGYGISPPVLVQDPNTKQISGLDYDIWQEIGKELDLKVEFTEEAGWGNFIEGLKAGRYDAFCSEMWADAGRTKNLTLSIPVLYSSLEAYVRADDHRFDAGVDRANAADITIPAVEGDTSAALVRERFPLAKIYALPQTATLSDMLAAVQSQKADLVFMTQGMVVGFEKENPGVLRRVTGIPAPFIFGSRYGVLNGEIQLRDMIDVVLRKMIDDGRIAKMAKVYSPHYAAPAKNYESP